MSRICLSLTATTLERDVELLARERPYVDLVELRADYLQPGELAHLARFPALVNVPVILTLRRVGDGGQWRESTADRCRLLRKTLGQADEGLGFAFAEVEHDLADPALEDAARARGCRLIRSLYDFRGVPADLAARVRRLAGAGREGPGGLPKAAVRVRGSRDQRRLAEVFRELQGVEKILLGMGEFGSFSGILAGKLGSWLTYCSPWGSVAVEGEGPGGGSANGEAEQVDPRTLVDLYRFRRIGPDTAVYGVVGNPIAHSRSPHLHNPGFAALNLDAVYVPFLADELSQFLRAAEALDVRGLSVTVPFKEQALRLAWRAGAKAAEGGAQPGEAGLHPGGEGGLLSAAGAEARAVGAANTLLAVGGEARRWRAANTDVAGFLAPLEREAAAVLQPGAGAEPGGEGRPFPAAGAAVLGAGGAARAVVYALTRRGLNVLVLNRTPARARALARRFGCQWGGLGEQGAELLSGHSALIVQATTVGLDGAGDPLPEYAFRGGEIVYELVYGSAPTPFLARARAAGCQTIGGLAMLRAQAAAQFRLFTGRDLPEDGPRSG